MQETEKVQHVPVKVYRSADRLTVAAPMPGIQPEDIHIRLSEQGRLTIQANVRGMLKDIKELLIDEWSVGGYYRELDLPNAVDGVRANAIYGNGVLVVYFPLHATMVPAELKLVKVGVDHGEYVGHSGHTHP